MIFMRKTIDERSLDDIAESEMVGGQGIVQFLDGLSRIVHGVKGLHLLYVSRQLFWARLGKNPTLWFGKLRKRCTE
jgi:uncharacterized membrane protein